MLEKDRCLCKTMGKAPSILRDVRYDGYTGWWRVLWCCVVHSSFVLIVESTLPDLHLRLVSTSFDSEERQIIQNKDFMTAGFVMKVIRSVNASASLGIGLYST